MSRFPILPSRRSLILKTCIPITCSYWKKTIFFYDWSLQVGITDTGKKSSFTSHRFIHREGDLHTGWNVEFKSSGPRGIQMQQEPVLLKNCSTGCYSRRLHWWKRYSSVMLFQRLIDINYLLFLHQIMSQLLNHRWPFISYL